MSESNSSVGGGETYTTFQLTMMRELWLRKCEKWERAVVRSKEQSQIVHEKNLHRVTALLPGGGKPGSAQDQENRKLWNLVGNRRLSAHSVLAPVKLKEPTNDGLCHMTLNPHPLRHLSMMYPNLDFRKPGVKATSRAAFTRYYESEVLRPMRYTMRYEMGKTALLSRGSASATFLGGDTDASLGAHRSASLGRLQPASGSVATASRGTLATASRGSLAY